MACAVAGGRGLGYCCLGSGLEVELTVAYSVTPELRVKLKEPFGLLIRGTSSETMDALGVIVAGEKPPAVVAVGDIVSQNMVEQGLVFDVLIVDNKTMRKPIQPITVDADQTLYAKNPPGTITDEAWDAIRQATDYGGRTKIIIDGEEDLLTIVTVLSAPENAFVVYGQPHKGVVVVKVNKETKKNMRRIVDMMADSSKS